VKALLVFTDQFSDVLAAGPEAAAADLRVDERLECFGE
jgi:hypothetical protein